MAEWRIGTAQTMDIKSVSKKTYKTDFRSVYPKIMGIKKKSDELS